MRVALNRTDFHKATGPLLFAKRLVDELILRGVKIVDIHDDPDILFALIHYSPSSVSAKTKVVLRVDGIYWNLQDRNIKMNKSIFQSINSADGVVFQSQFCKKCVEVHNRKHPKNTVILNGINMDTINRIPPKKLPKEPGLAACAQWRPSKRPNSVCEGFLASTIKHQLYMIGEPPKNRVKHSRITWMGDLSHHDSIAVMKACTHAIHLGKFDPCPNSVVEAIGCGLPVLHTANGGTPEIVKDQGIKIPVDGDWNFKFMKSVDEIDPKVTASALEKLVKLPPTTLRTELTMGYVADRYLDFFKDVMRSA